MDNNNSFDWMAVQLQGGMDKSFDDLGAMGVDSSNTTLQTPDFYKSKPKVQDIFKAKDGSFDDDRFNAFYTDVAKSFNAYKQADTSLSNATTDLWNDNSITRALNLPLRRTPVEVSLASKEPFTALKNAQNSFFGLTEINKWSKPQKSIAEVAEGRSVVDGITGKDLGYTPEDTGLYNLYGFLSEPLVLAQYDKDQTDDKGKVIHKRGEYKFDDKGLPFYETLSGRDMAGKQVLSRWDTLTKEGSYWNKFDFMDSDDLNKSMTGSIVKAAVQYAPMLIPGLNNAYAAYTIASGLVDGGSEIVKAIDGIVNGPNAKDDSIYKWANELQGYAGQMKSQVSQHAKDNWWDMENLLNMAVDSVYILKSQNAIVQWPMEYTKYQMAKELGVETESMLNVGEDATKAIHSIDTYAAKYGSDLVQAAKQMSGNMDKLAMYQKYASHLSTAYMAATTAASISNMADSAGIDARDKGFLYLGYASALMPFFNSQFGHWVNGKVGLLEEYSSTINKTLEKEGVDMFPEIQKTVEDKIAPTNLKGRAMARLAEGKELAQRIINKIKGVDFNSWTGAIVANTIDMTAQKGISDALQVVYNGLASAGFKSTQQDAKFDISPVSIAKDLLSEAGSGALGGAMFHLAHLMTGNVNHDFKSDHLYEYSLEGYSPQVLETIQKMKDKGQLGSTTLSIDPLKDENGNVVSHTDQSGNSIPSFFPVNEQHPVSQNDFVAERLTKVMHTYDRWKEAYNMVNPNVTAEQKAQYYNGIVDPKTDTDLRLQLKETQTQIFKLAADMESTDTLSKETDESMLEKKGKMKLLNDKLKYLQSDDSIDEFFIQGLFNIRSDINTKFGVKNRETIATELTGRPYKELTKAQQGKVDEKYREYVADDGQTSLMADLSKGRAEYHHFQEIMEHRGHYNEIQAFRDSMNHLRKYVRTVADPYIPEGEEEPVAMGATHLLTRDYFDKLAGVKYIPDHVYDIVKENIGKVASAESDEVLKALSVTPTVLKESVNHSLKGDLNNNLIREYVKKLIGDKQFDALTSMKEYKDVVDNKVPRSNYSTLRMLRALSDLHGQLNEPKLREQLALVDSLVSVDQDDLNDRLYMYNTGETDKNDAILQQYSHIDGLFDYIDKLREQEQGDDTWGQMFTPDGLKRFVMVNHMEKKLGQELDEQERDALYEGFDLNNIFTSMLAEGKYSIGNEDLHSHTINNLDDSTIRQSMDLVENFDKERVSSPLHDNLSDQYAFLKDQMENLNTVGPANYLNTDPTFTQALDSNLAAVERVAALVDATASMNPMINDFRKAHKGLIDATRKDVVMSVLDDDDKNTLLSEVGRLHYQLKYLKDVNEFNSNNQLAKLLREDGYEAVSKLTSLREIAQDSRVSELLPSLQGIFASGPLSDYADQYKNASTEQKDAALVQMVGIEENLYQDFQKLSKGEQDEVANLTFKPINPDDPEFYSGIDPKYAMTDANRTIYLATIFGTSTLSFYHRYAGEFDEASNAFKNLDKSPYIPFAKQETAVRVANLVINGNRDMVDRLFNAFSYADVDPADGPIDYSKPAFVGFDSSHIMAVLGSPGVGKTTAILYHIMNMVSDKPGNTVILAPKGRQVGALENSLVKGGFENRIHDRSDTVRNFLKGLLLRNKDGSLFDFAENDQAIQYDDSSKGNAQLFENFNNFLTVPSTADKNAGILEKLDLFTRKKLNPDIVKLFQGTRLIALDEFTHVNPIDIAILTHIVEAYNKTDAVVADPSKNITIVTLGDSNQMGFVDPKTGFRRDYPSIANMIISPPVTASLRSGWDLMNNTLVDVTRRTINVKHIAATNPEALTSTEVLQDSRNNSIKLFNYEGPDGNIGIRSIKTSDDIKSSDLSFISDNVNKANTPVQGKDIVYVVNSADQITKAQALLRDAFGTGWAERVNIEVYTPEEVQGGEYKYAIIAAQPRISPDGKNRYDIVRTHEFLNTMLSRASQATLFLDSGSMDQFVTFENTHKERAINQAKITDKVIEDVKAAKQRLLAAILPDYVPEGAKPGEKADAVSKKPLAVVPIKRVIFEDPPPPAASGISAKVSNITAYTTFSTKRDFDLIKKLPKVEVGISDDKVENIINSLKYYLVRGDEVGEGNVAVAANFQNYLSGYNYDSPRYFIEATKREGDNVPYGRSEVLFPNPNPKRDVLYLKIKLASNTGGEPLTLTLGALNDISELGKKYKGAKTLDEKDKQVNAFVQQLADYMANPKKTMDYGTAENGVWRSREYSSREFKQLSTVWGARLFHDNSKSASFDAIKRQYPDFYMSDPQVVVSVFGGEDGKPIVDPTGENPDYKKYWKALSGKSVAFLSEYKELQSLTPDQILDVYIKQLSLFNTPEFKKMSYDEKKQYVDNLKDRIQIDNGRFSLPYKPNMVEMIRLDNPRSSFLNFRERYLVAIAQHERSTPVQQLFEKFDMTPYVKDRIAKSLLTIRQFLSESKDNRDWFNTNILPKQNENSSARIADIRQQALDLYGESIDVDQDFSRHDNFDEVVLDGLGKVDSAQDFLDKLNSLLEVDKPDSIFRRKYDTLKANDSAARVDKFHDDPVTANDLNLTLTTNKRADFSKNILDLNLLNLFKQTKNLNFAELIDASLKAFATFPKGEKRFDKFRLDSVFENGEIENMVVAQRSSLKGNDANNILADVKYVGNSYQFGFKSLQQAAINIDFSKVLDSMKVESSEATDEQVSTLALAVNDRLMKMADLPEDFLEHRFGDLQQKLDKLSDKQETFETLNELNDRLDRLNETVRVPEFTTSLTPDTETAYDVTKNGVIATHTVTSDTMRGLRQDYAEFKKLATDEINLEFKESDKDQAIFEVKTDEGQFVVTYNAKDRSVDIDRVPEEDEELTLEKFGEQSGDGEKDPGKILNTAAKELGVSFLNTEPHKISTKENLEEALGKKLHDNMTDSQVDLIMGHGWRDNSSYIKDTEHTKDFYRDLATTFLDKFVNDKDYIDKMLETVHSAMEAGGAEATVGDDAPDVVFDPYKQKEVKNKKTPMDKLIQDLKDENAKSQREFEYQTKDLFKGAEKEDPIKGILKNAELLHRYAVLNKKISVSNLDTNLMETGVANDVALIDPVTVSKEMQMEQQAHSDIYRKYKEAFKALSKYTIDKTKTIC